MVISLIKSPKVYKEKKSEEVDYVNNFEKSNYVTKMNLFSIVPYGINTTSASCGYTSREMKHKLILGLYAELTKDMKTNIYNLIESHLHLNPKNYLTHQINYLLHN